MAKVGRPKGSGSLYTEELAIAICARIAEGEPLRKICREEGMPNWRTVYDWSEENAEFRALLARARKSQFDAIAAECLEIADDATQDFIPTEKGMAFNAEHVQRSKLRIETRMKLLAKWDPKRYGERLELDGALTVKKQAADLTDDELAAIAANRRPKDSLGST